MYIKKGLLLVLLLFIVPFSTSCNRNQISKSKENLPRNVQVSLENKQEIENLHREFHISDITNLLLADSNKYFIPYFFRNGYYYGVNGEEGNEIIRIDKDDNKEVLLRPSDANKGIVNFKLYDNFIIWIEVDKNYFKNPLPGFKWSLNIIDTNTQNRKEIEASKNIEENKLKEYYKTYYYFPSDISVSNGKVVYSNFDLNDNNKIFQGVKYYDIYSNSKKLVDSRIKVDGFFSAPYIQDDEIVYSYSIFRGNSILTDSKVYAYSLVDNKITELPGNQYINPKISSNFIIAEERNDGDVNGGRVAVYNLKTKYWTEIYNYKIAQAPTDMKKSFCMEKVSVADNIVFISANISSIIIGYDLTNKSYSIIDSVEKLEVNDINIICSDSKSIMWIKDEADKPGKSKINIKLLEFR
ncbi:hypothetical protein SAMN05444401_0382 [Clostridium amylolyticum]|uniref:Uncharacterized protein n=1 Tax=Clostridium amylolyticum TaxID=1121298 RepID=A0A1M6P098_9CLOT|nr:hypothetical protein [Clostridium amylolyticum]SHK01338.1 hypothetical protein SAMN05444401_0382 [Clostridium amylolyticum]